jgi:hypothetical protein
MSEKPQEWTPEYVDNDLLRYWPRSKGLCAKIAEAHNAALAAERKKKEAAWRNYEREREKVEGYRRHALRVEGTCKTGGASELMVVSHQLGLADKENFELRQQLAAEREKNDELTKQIAIGLKRENELSKELAAEREKVKTLVEALRSIAENTCCDRCQEAALVARAALAK